MAKTESHQEPELWEDIFAQAEVYYLGENEKETVPQDYVAALKLYKQAAKLGSVNAYPQIGSIYEGGLGVREDKKKALAYYKTGAEKGSWICHGKMMQLFFCNMQEKNGQICFQHFIKSLKENLLDWTNEINKIGAVLPLIWFAIQVDKLGEFDIPQLTKLRDLREDILTSIERHEDFFQQRADAGWPPPDESVFQLFGDVRSFLTSRKEIALE